MSQIDSHTGVNLIEGTLMQAQKSGENMDPVIRQEYLAMSPADRRAALIQIDKDRQSNPNLPGLEITDRGDGDATVKSDTRRSASTWIAETTNNAEANARQTTAKGEKDLKDFWHALSDPFNNERKKVPGQN